MIFKSNFGSMKLRKKLEVPFKKLMDKTLDKRGRRTRKTVQLERLIDTYCSSRAEFEWRLGMVPKEF